MRRQPDEEIRQRTKVVGIFPARTALVRLLDAVLMEQTAEWTETGHYIGLKYPVRTRAARRGRHHTRPRDRQPQSRV
ncbi:transposase [Actinomadura geliboluensis]|uniref:transposase n=1 Tax=Actinomadura geliboluensis TaxID=882440 RepID=UPI0037184A87